MSSCCLNTVLQSDSSFETFAAPVADRAARLTAGLTRSVRVRGQTLGHMEEQLFAEAQRHGLAQAAKVLVVADGAVWIWNLPGDRFSQAHQRLDCYHAGQHLWAVAHVLHPEDESAARAWVAPLLRKLKSGRAPALLNDLRTLAKRLRQKKRQAVEPN